MDEARELIHDEFGLPRDAIGRSEVDRVLAVLKYRLVKKLDEEALELASHPYGSEYGAVHAEEAASAVVELQLPEERLRIVDLLKVFLAPGDQGAEAARRPRRPVAAEPERVDRGVRHLPWHGGPDRPGD